MTSRQVASGEWRVASGSVGAAGKWREVSVELITLDSLRLRLNCGDIWALFNVLCIICVVPRCYSLSEALTAVGNSTKWFAGNKSVDKTVISTMSDDDSEAGSASVGRCKHSVWLTLAAITYDIRMHDFNFRADLNLLLCETLAIEF